MADFEAKTREEMSGAVVLQPTDSAAWRWRKRYLVPGAKRSCLEEPEKVCI